MDLMKTVCEGGKKTVDSGSSRRLILVLGELDQRALLPES